MNDFYSLRARLLRVLLRPAVRYCLSSGVSAVEALDAFKTELLAAAQKEMGQKGEKATISRLSVMTGMQRREIARLQDAALDSEPFGSYSQRVLGQWEQDPRFLTKSGKPKVLSFGFDESEFTQAVRLVSKDINPAAMLAELERIGAAVRTKVGLKLVSVERSYAEDPEKAYDLLARDIETLVLSGEENLERAVTPKNLHLRTEFDNIFREDLPKIREWLLEQGSAFHKRAREFLSRYDNDINPNSRKTAGAKVVIKAFGWTNAPKD